MCMGHDRGHVLVPVVGILLMIVPCSWTQCTPYCHVQQLGLNPAPVEYDSGGEITDIPSGCSESPPSWICGSGMLPIGDGEYGPDAINLTDLSAVYAWNQDVSITVGMNAVQETRVTGINIFFYNIPSMGIGLPHEIELNWGTSPTRTDNRLDHVVLGNQDLSEDDNILRNVTIAALATDEADEALYRSINITFRFSDANNIRWLLLSEIEICNDTMTIPTLNPIPMANEGNELIQLGASNIQSELNITCTVTTEGSFQWRWMRQLMDTVESFANANRTSTCTLTRISSNSAGPVMCQAMYTTEPTSTSLREFMLQFDPPVLEALDTTVIAQTNSSVTLSCEIYGYLPYGDQPQISWQKLPDMLITSIYPLYTISSTTGSKQIQNGGSTPGPSFVSSLTIDVVDETVAGTYLCSSSTGTTIPSITLTVTDTGDVEITTTATSRNGSDTMLVLTGGAIGAVAMILLITVVIVSIILVTCAKKGYSHYHMNSNVESKDLNIYNGSEQFYQEVPKPLPPPLPARFPSPMGSSQIDPYVLVDSKVTGNIRFEWMECNFEHHASVSSEPESNATPMRLKQRPNCLHSNPLYVTSDTVDPTDLPASPFRREVGSVPQLDSSDAQRESAFSIYTQNSPPIPHWPPTPTWFSNPIYSDASLSLAVFREPFHPTSSLPDGQIRPYASVYSDPDLLMRSEGPLEVSAHNIREKFNLGEGQFGQVVLAETVGLSLKDLRLSEINSDRSVSVLVAVKKLKLNADHFVREAFEKEIKFMTRLRHANIVQLLGICLQEDAFIMMEYMESGDLNQYLHRSEICPPGSIPGKNQLSPLVLLHMCVQIANGMKYLASFHFIHRDLATRNCLVGKNNEVKIADFGMSRSLYSSYYYRIRGRAMLPIRWMANECFYGKFSEKTDIWAFGVTMWEIYMFAKKPPYEDMTDQEVIDDAIKGPDRELLTRPEHCPPEIFDVMLSCWFDDPEERANFENLHSYLAAIYDSISSAP